MLKFGSNCKYLKYLFLDIMCDLSDQIYLILFII
jgi:hypothetical protein